jgi:glycosyltransferase involved in cell wall biosynthesis
MKTILIKIGKVSSLIKREGLINGIKLLFSRYLKLYFKTLFTPVSGDVLIISAGVGDSAYYRAFNHAEELNIHSIKTSVIMQDDPFLIRHVDKCQVFVFQRTFVTPTIEKMIAKIKQQKKEIIFETDDLVFDAKYIQQTDLYKHKMNSAEKMQYKKGIGSEIIKDDYTKVCTTPTSYLAQEIEKYEKKVFVVKNKFSNYELNLTQNILDNLPKEKDDPGVVRIGYFSGTSSHNQDFASVQNVLMEILRKNENVKLFLAGPLDVDNKLNKYKDRIVAMPFVPRNKYYENIWKVDINVAPLVLDDPFCEAKSEIKFTETGILKIPTVAVRNQTFSEAIEDGEDGFLADNKKEWVEKIEKLVKDEKLRKLMGEKARKKVLRDYTNKNSHNTEYYDYLKNCLEKDNS